MNTLFPILCLLAAVVLCVASFTVGWWVSSRPSGSEETLAGTAPVDPATAQDPGVRTDSSVSLWLLVPALFGSLALLVWQQTWSYDTNFIVGLFIVLIAFLALIGYMVLETIKVTSSNEGTRPNKDTE